jgi:hypothetical protein
MKASPFLRQEEAGIMHGIAVMRERRRQEISDTENFKKETFPSAVGARVL